MPELWEVKGAAKIRLFGPKDALDRVQTPAGVNQGRVAPDELLWIGDPEQAGALEAEGQKQLAGVGEDPGEARIIRRDVDQAAIGDGELAVIFPAFGRQIV